MSPQLLLNIIIKQIFIINDGELNANLCLEYSYFDVKKYHVNQFVSKGNKVELRANLFSVETGHSCVSPTRPLVA